MKKDDANAEIQDGKVYKIVCKKTGLCYIGSTKQKYLSDRLAKHTYRFRKFKEGEIKSNLTSFKVLENGDYDIELIEKVPFTNVEELYKREKYHIINTPNSVNKTIPTRTGKEYRNDNIQKIQERHNNDIKCDCGIFVKYCNMARHKKSALHAKQCEIIEKQKNKAE